MRCHAYTLVEVLAVTVLLGLVASLGAPPLLRAITGDPLRQAAERLGLAFRDVRAQGYGHRVDMQLESWGFTAATLDEGRRLPLPEGRLPDAIQATWTRDGRAVNRLEIDPRGHGLDTAITLHHDARELAFTVDGLTGRWLPRPQP